MRFFAMQCIFGELTLAFVSKISSLKIPVQMLSLKNSCNLAPALDIKQNCSDFKNHSISELSSKRQSLKSKWHARAYLGYSRRRGEVRSRVARSKKKFKKAIFGHKQFQNGQVLKNEKRPNKGQIFSKNLLKYPNLLRFFQNRP